MNIAQQYLTTLAIDQGYKEDSSIITDLLGQAKRYH